MLELSKPQASLPPLEQIVDMHSFIVLALALASYVSYGYARPANQTYDTLQLLTKRKTTYAQAASEAQVITTANDAPWYLNRIERKTKYDDSEIKAIKARIKHYDFEYKRDNEWGKGVLVYVIDSGVLATHVEFAKGQVEDGIEIQLDKATNQYVPKPGSKGNWDEENHGTPSASIIAGRRTGVAKSATIVPVKNHIGAKEGNEVHPKSTLQVLGGLRWAVEDFKRRKATKAVINISQIIRHLDGDLLETAIQDAIKAGMHVVIAAGNDNKNECYESITTWERRVKNVGQIVVSSIDVENQHYYNWGPCVDILAPGTQMTMASGVASDFVMSADQKQVIDKPDGHKADVNAYYVSDAGTSYSAPLVSGVIAAILSKSKDNIDPKAMREKLLTHYAIADPNLRNDLFEADHKTTNKVLFIDSAHLDAEK